MQYPRTSKCTICSNRYALNRSASSAYDNAQKIFVRVPCVNVRCDKICCFACRFDCEDPFDCFNFELDTCTYCNHLQQRNKMSFNKKMKNCWFKQQTNIWSVWRKLETTLKNGSQRENGQLVCECRLLPEMKLFRERKKKSLLIMNMVIPWYYQGVTMVIPRFNLKRG